jgi:ABC-type oligopeptide transport system ATPase subunit
MESTTKTLNPLHQQHLSLEGFSDELIEKFNQDGLIESLTPDEAYKAGFGVAIDNKPVTGGLKFNFSPTFSQLRLDDREIFKKDNGNGVTYLSLGGAVTLDCAYIPDGCKAITEGMKDALAFTHISGIPTGAVAGVSHVTKALPKNCKYTIIFDHDAWNNFEVFISLIRAGVHCNGKVAIIPEIEGYPKAGGCEYFKSGKTSPDYQQLLDSAQSPIAMFDTWFERQEITDVKSAVTVAVQAAKLMGELYGYADAVTVEAIKDLLKNSKLSEWNLTTANIIRDSYNTQKSLKAKEKAEDDTDTRNAVKIAIEIVKERADLFHSPSPDSTEYADIPSKTGVMTTHAISSREFKSWVTGEFYRDIGEGLTNESMNTVLATIHAIAAHDSPELPVSEQRIAAHDGRYYLYLADESQTVIEYSAVGWNICENSPVKFVFDKYKAALPVPQRQGSIDKLWDLIRIKNIDDRLMVTAILVKGLVPGGTDPILAISGYAGSGKTTTANYLRSLIDPFTKGKVLAKIPEIDHIAIHAKKRRILAIDNISHITADQSDTLCNVSTGGGFSKRTLFSDDGETILDVQNLTILTSIGNVVTKPDLLERSVVLDLTRLTPEDRASESDLSSGFDRYHGDILGGLLNITVAALNHRDTTQSPKYSRMTEFAHLGEGVEKSIFNAIESILERRMAAGAEIANEIAIEASPVASTLRSWILTQEGVWTGSASDLLNILKSHAKKSELAGSLPKTANSLSGELKKCESALHQSGISISSDRIGKNRNRVLSVYAIDLPPSKDVKRSSASSASEKQTLEDIPSNDSLADDLADDPQNRSSASETAKTPEVLPSNNILADDLFEGGSSAKDGDDDPIVDEV